MDEAGLGGGDIAMTDDEKAALADVYERAAEYLEEYGWVQHSGGGEGDSACVAVSIYRVQCGQVSLSDAFRFFADALELKGDSCFDVYNWNDEPDRTKDEVINTLHALANQLR